MPKWEPLCFSDLIFPKCSGPKSCCHLLFEVATPQAEPGFLVNRCGANTDRQPYERARSGRDGCFPSFAAVSPCHALSKPSHLVLLVRPYEAVVEKEHSQPWSLLEPQGGTPSGSWSPRFESHLHSYSAKSGVTSFACKGPRSEYFQLCEPYNLHCNYPPLLLSCGSGHRQYSWVPAELCYGL